MSRDDKGRALLDEAAREASAGFPRSAIGASLRVHLDAQQEHLDRLTAERDRYRDALEKIRHTIVGDREHVRRGSYPPVKYSDTLYKVDVAASGALADTEDA